MKKVEYEILLLVMTKTVHFWKEKKSELKKKWESKFVCGLVKTIFMFSKLGRFLKQNLTQRGKYTCLCQVTKTNSEKGKSVNLCMHCSL